MDPTIAGNTSVILTKLCQLPRILHTSPMAFVRRTILVGIAVLLAGCSQNRPRVKSELTDYHPPGTGPFDTRGNYIESWADKPSSWRSRSVPRPPSNLQRQTKETRDKPTGPAPQPPEIASHTPPSPPPTAAATPPPPRPKPKPKPVKVKPKKPAPIRVTVKKGDTLYGLSRRYKTTVAAIKKANGLKSDLIKPGQKLVVPRY